MLSPAGRSGLHAQTLALRLGCEVRETLPKVGWSQPALVGAKGELATRLKSAGGRWSSSDEAILFPTWSTLEEVLEEIVASRGTNAA
jgi:hypothetical protein